MDASSFQRTNVLGGISSTQTPTGAVFQDADVAGEIAGFGDRRLQGSYYYPAGAYPAPPFNQAAGGPIQPPAPQVPLPFNYAQAAYPPPPQMQNQQPQPIYQAPTSAQYQRVQGAGGPQYTAAPQQAPYFYQTPYVAKPPPAQPVYPQVQGVPQVQTGSGFSPVGFGYIAQGPGSKSKSI